MNQFRREERRIIKKLDYKKGKMIKKILNPFKTISLIIANIYSEVVKKIF